MMAMSDEGQNAGPDLENPTPPVDHSPTSTASGDLRRKWKTLMYAAILIAVISLSVSLGVLLPRSNDEDVTVSSSAAQSEGTVNSNDVLISISSIDPNESNDLLKDEGSSPGPTVPVTTDADESTSATSSSTTTTTSDAEGSSSPTSVTDSGGSSTIASVTDSNIGTSNTTTSTVTDSALAPAVTTESATSSSSSATTATISTTESATTASITTDTEPPQTSSTAKYLDSNGPLPVKVRMIDPSAVDSYNSCDALKGDIIEALKLFANSVIVGEKDNDWWSQCNFDDPNWNPWDQNYFPPIAAYDYAEAEGAAADVAMAAPSMEFAGASSPVEDSFGTNNQVQGVDEADIVKSDGVHVFAAYGDLLYSWSAEDGTAGTSITRMPFNDTADDCNPYEPYPLYTDYDYESELVDAAETDTTTVSSNASASTSLGPEEEPVTSESKKRTTNDRQQRKRRGLSMPYYPPPCYKPKPQIVSLLLHEKRLTAIVSENNYMIEPLAEDAIPSLISDSSLMVARVYDASTVPTDGSPLTLLGERKIKGNYNSARSIESTGIIVTTSYVDTYKMANSLYRSQPLYCGLNNTEYEEKASKIALNRSEVFADQLINELDLTYGCSNIFQISAMQSGNTLDSTGGNLLSQFVSVASFDISANNFVDQEIPIQIAGTFASGYLSNVYASQDFVAALTVGSSYNENTMSWDQATFILGFDISNPTPVPYSFAEVPGSPINQYAADEFNGHFRIATTEWQWNQAEMTSRTTNKIFVLELPTDGSSTMKLVGSTDHLGKPNESIYAVRFIGDKGYVVTFESIDPFLIVDLGNPENPRVVGELELPGYSSYLHPITIDGVSLMLGVGQDVNETTGWTTGFKISLFDITDPSAPVEKTSFVDKDAYSNAQNDFKAFRYLELSQKLIVPLSEYTWTEEGNFDGFVVYDVAIDKIRPSYNISHASSDDIFRGCWYNAYMAPRSLVFQSKVTTILSHTVISTDLYGGTTEWKLNLDEGLNKTKTDCWSYFGYY